MLPLKLCTHACPFHRTPLRWPLYRIYRLFKCQFGRAFLGKALFNVFAFGVWALILQRSGCACVQTNERGKVSSRPGPMSPKGMQAQQAKAAAEQAEQASGTPEEQPPAAPQPQQPAAQTSYASTQAKRDPVAATPQVVTDRMLKRIIVCAGLPVAVGILLLPLFYYLAIQSKARGEDFPMWVVYIAQFFAFGGGLAGITYGILSTSWDPMREGSVGGWTEFQANLPVLLNRNKQQ